MSANPTIVRRAIAGLTLGSAALIGAMHQWESQELVAYADKLAGNLPTYCSGATSWAVKPGTKFTQAECDAVDAATASEYGRAVLACIPADKLDQNSFDAITLFAINVGKKGACGSRAATLIRAGKREEGCRALSHGPDGKPAWSFAGGVYVRGLQNRRLFEENWCLRTATGGQP